jgi:hypothetical protein
LFGVVLLDLRAFESKVVVIVLETGQLLGIETENLCPGVPGRGVAMLAEPVDEVTVLSLACLHVQYLVNLHLNYIMQETHM